jgi:hypothetical protein
MKHIGLALLVFSIFSLAQAQQASDVQAVRHDERRVSKTPTPEDMYCGGFITTQRVSEAHRIIAGQNSPDQARYAGGTDRVFIVGAADVKPGDRMEIVRPVRNPNRYEVYTGENKLIKETGQLYFERGYVRVLEVQKNVAIAMPELSCADMIPGDLAIPFVERDTPQFQHVTLERYTPPNGKATGRIVLANEFDTYLGSTQKVYLSIGEDKGLKVGDYLRVTRSYDYVYRERESNLSALATDMEDTVYNTKKIPQSEMRELPRLTLGDVIVLSVHPRSATAMIVTALEDIRIGDGVEVMDVNEAAAAPGDAH